MTLSPWLTALLLLVVYTAAAVASSSIPRRRSSSFANLHRITSKSQNIHQLNNIPRGGDDEYDSEEYDSDEYDSEEEEDEPIVTKTKKLASSTKNVVQTKKRKEVKSKVKVALSSSSSKSKSVSSRSNSGSGGIYKRYVPYIIRAVLNPFVLMRMTKSYFVSLCDINYLKEEQSQTLRSALNEKARKAPSSGGSGSTKPKRKMKPGQAKTLSDLPQLSA